jgi:hypothetical protein
MKSDISLRVGSIKEFIESLEKEFGGLRKAGEELGIDWQRLQYYKKSPEKLQKFLDFLEDARKKTKKSKSAVWDSLITKKKD